MLDLLLAGWVRLTTPYGVLVTIILLLDVAVVIAVGGRVLWRGITAVRRVARRRRLIKAFQTVRDNEERVKGSALVRAAGELLPVSRGQRRVS